MRCAGWAQPLAVVERRVLTAAMRCAGWPRTAPSPAARVPNQTSGLTSEPWCRPRPRAGRRRGRPPRGLLLRDRMAGGPGLLAAACVEADGNLVVVRGHETWHRRLGDDRQRRRPRAIQGLSSRGERSTRSRRRAHRWLSTRRAREQRASSEAPWRPRHHASIHHPRTELLYSRCHGAKTIQRYVIESIKLSVPEWTW